MKKRSIFYMGSCLLPTIATTPVCLWSIQSAGVPLDRPPLHARQPLLSDLSRHSSALEPRLRHHFELNVKESSASLFAMLVDIKSRRNLES